MHVCREDSWGHPEKGGHQSTQAYEWLAVWIADVYVACPILPGSTTSIDSMPNIRSDAGCRLNPYERVADAIVDAIPSLGFMRPKEGSARELRKNINSVLSHLICVIDELRDMAGQQRNAQLSGEVETWERVKLQDVGGGA